MDSMCLSIDHKLIVTVVRKGLGSKVVEATKTCGAEGGTIFLGSGTTKEEIYYDVLGLNYEPEKEIVFTFVNKSIADSVLNCINERIELNKAGVGISFMIDITRIAGICHLMNI